MLTTKIPVLFGLTISACIYLAGAKTRERLVFEKPIKIIGKIETRTYYGPPNYEKDDVSKKEHVFVLVLSKHVDVVGNPDAKYNYDSFNDVSVVQISNAMKFGLKKYLGKLVIIDGTLTQAMIGHEHTNVIVHIDKIERHKPR